jgi:hypothetical protein
MHGNAHLRATLPTNGEMVPMMFQLWHEQRQLAPQQMRLQQREKHRRLEQGRSESLGG